MNDPLPRPDSNSQPIEPSASRTLGVFPGEDDDLGVVEALDGWLEGRLGTITTFVAATVPPARRRTFVHEYLTGAWDRGLTPILTWEPFDIGADGRSPVQAIIDGEASDLLAAWASTLAEWIEPADADPRELFLRPAHEMNGSWYPWSAGNGVTPAQYRECWHRLREAVAAVGVPEDRVHWLWSMNADTTASVDPLEYYPGDDAVDWVGVDGYNFGDSQEWSCWRDPASVFESAFERLRTETDAPLGVPELGSSSLYAGTSRPELKAAWITSAFELLDAWDVGLASWFNTRKETDWPVFEADGGGRYPATTQIEGTPYGCYPCFRQAAIDYHDEAGL